MKLGVAGLLPSDWRRIDREAALQVRQAGFRGAQWFFPKPLLTEHDEVEGVRRAFAEANLEIAQVNGWYECLVNPDEELRSEGVRGMQALCRLGRYVGAPSVFVRPGSLNPNGHWWPHSENHTYPTFERLINSLRQICSTAEEEGVIVAVEGHVVSPLDTPQKVRDLLDAVGSDSLKFNFDPVNFMGTVSDVYDTRRVLNQLFDLLGEDTIVAHAKDVNLRDAHVVHIDEVLLGTGKLDYENFLTNFQKYCPDSYILIEHLPDEKIPLARQAFVDFAERYAIPLEV